MHLIYLKTQQYTLQFLNSEKASGILLILATGLSLCLANSDYAASYAPIWHTLVAGLTIEHWINDGLMAIFFLLIGLELERELYTGELANIKDALLPIIAATGGMLLPAAIHFGFNAGTESQSGIGIPMATDIAFAIGVLALIGKNIPYSLKVFLVAFAVIDDLGAAIMIALFYSTHIVLGYLLGAIAVWGILIWLNRMRIMKLLPYLAGGILMWWLTLKSGVHATLAGIALAFAIPFTAIKNDEASPSFRLEHAIHKPVSFIILPLFALANTGVTLAQNWFVELGSSNSLGIMAGLLIGKPLGVVGITAFATWLGLCKIPNDIRWIHMIGAGLLGGIGFTMSIFITNLAFHEHPEMINNAKMAILVASLTAGIFGYLWLKITIDKKSP